jgi:predicted nucleotidyltransferase
VRDDDLQWLCEALASTESYLPGTAWYLFGSVLRRNGHNRDIDVLVLYEKWEDVVLIRKRIEEREMERPLDLLFLTFEEEAELGFIQSEACIEIFPSSHLIPLIP